MSENYLSIPKWPVSEAFPDLTCGVNIGLHEFGQYGRSEGKHRIREDQPASSFPVKNKKQQKGKMLSI